MPGPDPTDTGSLDAPRDGLAESDVLASPYLQIRTWVDGALAAAHSWVEGSEPLALAVATVDPDGAPNLRTVLMRFFDDRGPGFVTNLESTKSVELAANRRIAAGLTWPAMHRAIRFRGVAEPLSRQEVAEYFDSRPYGSRLSAWASEQSRPASGREELERRWHEALERYPDRGQRGDVPVPDFWGGYRIRCDEVEFWAGRRNRLHDRLVFTRTGDGSLSDTGSWTLSRRQP
jgi:pyridoxamine 5'-phosphate oxidase